MGHNFSFKRPLSKEDLALDIKRVELAIETIASAALARVRYVSTNPAALKMYVDNCVHCKGLLWTFHCKGCKASGRPPDQHCFHLTVEESDELFKLRCERVFLDDVAKEMGVVDNTIEVTDLDKEAGENPLTAAVLGATLARVNKNHSN